MPFNCENVEVEENFVEFFILVGNIILARVWFAELTFVVCLRNGPIDYYRLPKIFYNEYESGGLFY